MATPHHHRAPVGVPWFLTEEGQNVLAAYMPMPDIIEGSQCCTLTQTPFHRRADHAEISRAMQLVEKAVKLKPEAPKRRLKAA